MPSPSNCRRAPACSSKSYKIGTRKRGVDGSMYVVSKLNNGVKRWVKAGGKKTSSTRRPRSSAMMAYPRSSAITEMPMPPPPPFSRHARAQRVRLYDGWNHKHITIPAYYSKPTGVGTLNTPRLIFYQKELEEFNRFWPHETQEDFDIYGGYGHTDRFGADDVLEEIERGAKVWVVDYIPDGYDEQ